MSLIRSIFYHPDGYTTSNPKLMGRNAAGESFLKGLLRHSSAKKFFIHVLDRAHAEQFKETAISLGRNEPVEVVDKFNLGSLQNCGSVFHPGPGISEHAYQRSFWGNNAWSLCGITHTTSSSRAMDSITRIITSPVQTWDALICTSEAVKQNVLFLLNKESDFLAERLGTSRLVLPKLPVIPLGVHTDEFIYTEKDKHDARNELNISEDTIVILYMGRLAFHAKAHPAPMYLALERAAKATKKKITLIECGWHANLQINQAFSQGAFELCPSVETKFLDGRNAKNRNIAWAAADIFCSLSDNIQETFGITPIEAMAAGLPSIVSDWDGYKDSIKHGITGFRIPTYMPQTGCGLDLSRRHALEIDTYDSYVGLVSTVTAIDVSATTDAFINLIENDDLRHKMGASAQKRAVEVYDWKNIIPVYEKLWDSLDEEREQNRNNSRMNSKTTWPARPDPFEAFAMYPSKIMHTGSIIQLTSMNLAEIQKSINLARSLSFFQYAKGILPTSEETNLIVESLSKKQLVMSELLTNFSENRRVHVLRGIGWLIKIGVVQVTEN